LSRAPTNPQMQFDVAIDLANAAVVAEFQQRYEEGFALRTRSVEMRRTLAAADPENVMLRGRLGLSLEALGRMEEITGRLPAARAHIVEAVTLHRDVIKTASDSVSAISLAQALEALGFIEERTGRHKESCRAYRESVDIFHRVPS